MATLSAIDSYQGEDLLGAIVRVRVEMSADMEPAFRESEIRLALVKAHHIAGVERRIRHEPRTRLGMESLESLTTMQAVRRYLEARRVSEERERLLLEYAERVLHEEIEGD